MPKVIFKYDIKKDAWSWVLIAKHKNCWGLNWHSQVEHIPDGLLNKILKLKNKYHLILTDNRMLELDGIEFIRSLRKENDNTPAILTSCTIGDLLEEDKHLFQGVVSKPFEHLVLSDPQIETNRLLGLFSKRS